MINAANFQEQTELTLDTIAALPLSEMKYYLTLLVKIIQNKNDVSSHVFLQEMQHFIQCLQNLTCFDRQEHNKDLLIENLYHSLQSLQKIAQTHTLWAQIKIVLLHLIGGLCSLYLGILGGLIGGVAGFTRGLWNLKIPIKYTGIGLLTGFSLGLILGFRAPKKLFKQEVNRQLTFGLDGLYKTVENLKGIESAYIPSNVKILPFVAYYAQVEEEIKNLFSNEVDFQQFLRKKTTYRINTFQASFIGQPMLHGYLGHHAYIQIKIQNKEFLVEFALTPADTTEPPAQSELRTVTGQKQIEMLALHRKYQETNPSTLAFSLGRLKFGDSDCFSYLNKILLGTSQKSVNVKRFANMTPVGNLVGSTIEYLSPIQPQFFQRNKWQNERFSSAYISSHRPK